MGKMKSLTIQEKLEIIEMIEAGKTVKDVSEETGMNRNSLHYILKNRNKIREEVSKNPTLSKHKRIKQTKNPELETAILNFIYESRDKKEKLTGSIIKAVALELSIKMNIQNFAASNGWLFSFFKRNGLSLSEFNNSMAVDVSVSEVTQDTQDIEVQESNVIQYEVEYTEEAAEEYTEVNEGNEWRNWCRFCGSNDSNVEVMSIGGDTLEMYAALVKFNLSNESRCCEKCKASLEESIKFWHRAKVSRDMFAELEELSTNTRLVDEDCNLIRQKYLTNVDEVPKIDENQEIIYEEDYLEEEVEEDPDKVQDYVVIEEQTIEYTESTRTSDEDYIYECHICGEHFDKMCFLTNHTRQLHSCLPQVACSCGKYLATWDSLMAHRRKHSTEPADWVCDICFSKFQTKTGLSIHIKFKHEKNTEKTKYLCDICNLEFNDSSALKSHLRTHNPGGNEKNIVECSFCNKQLSNKYSLKAHIATVHEKQKTILCHLCSKGFSNKSNLRSHLVSHTTEYVSCQICDQVFKNRVSLQSHKKIHKPHESLKFCCQHCDKRFHNRNHLERHMISHSSEKKFKCDVDGCSAAYKWEKDLKNHLAVHNGVKNHQCNYCERLFADVGNLRKHKLKHHSK